MTKCADCGNNRAVIRVGDDGDMLCTKCADELMRKAAPRFWITVVGYMFGFTFGVAVFIAVIVWIAEAAR